MLLIRPNQKLNLAYRLRLVEINKLLKAEIQDALVDGGIIEMDGVTVITEERDVLLNIDRIERVVRKVVDTTDVLFSLHDRETKLFPGMRPVTRPSTILSTAVGKFILGALKTDFDRVEECFPFHVLNPYVDAFIRRVKKFKLDGISSLAPFETVEQSVKVLNFFVESLRRQVRSERFKNKINNYSRASNKNLKGVLAYIDSLFERYARLLVVGVDLSYKNKFCDGYKAEDGVTSEQARAHRDKLLYDLKNKMFSASMVGYVWKLEYGLSKGYHYHILVFFDGSRVREDETLALIIGQHWRDVVTEDKGIYHSCNAKKEDYRRSGFGIGIGMINHDDYELRQNLRKAAAYLIKKDYYIRAAISGNGRAFGKGGMPNPKSDQRGRPRKARALA